MDFKSFLDELIKIAWNLAGIGLAALVTWLGRTYIIPFFKKSLSNQQFTYLESQVRALMASAEVKFKDPQTGKIKKEWVMEQLTQLGIVYDEEYVSNFIEGMFKILENEGVINNNK